MITGGFLYDNALGGQFSILLMEQPAKIYLLLERMRETVYCSTFQAVALLTFLLFFVYSMLRQKWG